MMPIGWAGLLTFLLVAASGGHLHAQDPPAAEAEVAAEAEDKNDIPGLDRSNPRALYISFYKAYNQLTADNEYVDYDTAREGGGIRYLDPAADCLELDADMKPRKKFGRVRLLAKLLNLLGDSTERLPTVLLEDEWRLDIPDLPGRAVVFKRADAGQWRFADDMWFDSHVAELERLGKEEREVFSLRRYVPDVLRRRVLFLEHWQWAGLVALIVLTWIVHRIVAFFVGQLIALVVYRKTRLEHTASVARESRKAFGFFAAALVIYFLQRFLRLPPEAERVVVILAKVVASVGAMLLAYRAADIFGARLEDAARESESRLDDQIAPMARKVLKLFITVAAVLFVLDNLQVDIVSFLAGLGVVGIGVGLAAKDTFANFFGSVTVLTDKPFTIGDWVKINDVEGTVEEIGFRSTRVRTFYNSLVSVPNAKLVDSSIDNMGVRAYRRFRTVVAVTYGTPPDGIEKFCEGICTIVKKSPAMRRDYFFVHLNDFGASSLDILVYVFFEVPDWGAELQARQDFMLAVLRLAEELGVSFAFPSQSVYLESTPDSAGQP